MNKENARSSAVVHILLFLGSLVMVMPFLWMILTSLKTFTESTAVDPFVFFPRSLQWQNYKIVINQNPFLRLYINTFSMMLFRILSALVFSSMAAFSFARLKFPGRDFLFGIVLVQMMIPVQIFIIPQYLMIDALDARNTIFALVFPGLVSAFGTFLLRQFYLGLPRELEESAYLDGCSIGQNFVRVMMPLTKSGMTALGIFTALFSFKDLMWPLIVNNESKAATLASALARIQSAYSVEYPQLMAASVIAILPMLVIFFFFQRRFMEGIATTGGKL